MQTVQYPQFKDADRIREEDRQYVEELLKEAFAQNRLDLDEYEKRTELLVNAQTRTELEYLIKDIAVPGSFQRASRQSPTVKPVSGPVYYSTGSFPHITIMGDRSTTLELTSGHHNFVTIMGDNKVYIKAAPLDTGILTISTMTIMGDLVIFVPAGISVRMNVVPIMADVMVDPRLLPYTTNTSQELIINGVVIMGDVRVVPY